MPIENNFNWVYHLPNDKPFLEGYGMEWFTKLEIQNWSTSPALYMRRVGPYGPENRVLMETFKQWLRTHDLFTADCVIVKNLMTVPVSKPALVLAKMTLLFLFSVSFMAVGGLVNLVIVLASGLEPVGFWKLFFVGIGQGIMMWAGALPCVLLVVLLNRSYIISVIITFFYTAVNYIFGTNDYFIMQPFGFNPGTLLPGPLTFRWFFQYLDTSGAQMTELMERISPYFVTTPQAFLVVILESVVFLTLIALVYKRQSC